MGGVQLAAASTIGGPRTESWSYKTARTTENAKVFRAHAAPQGVCDTVINGLKLLANQQTVEGVRAQKKLATLVGRT